MDARSRSPLGDVSLMADTSRNTKVEYAVEQMSLVNAFLSDVAYSNLSALQLSQHLDYAPYNVE